MVSLRIHGFYFWTLSIKFVQNYSKEHSGVGCSSQRNRSPLIQLAHGQTIFLQSRLIVLPKLIILFKQKLSTLYPMALCYFNLITIFVSSLKLSRLARSECNKSLLLIIPVNISKPVLKSFSCVLLYILLYLCVAYLQSYDQIVQAIVCTSIVDINAHESFLVVTFKLPLHLHLKRFVWHSWFVLQIIVMEADLNGRLWYSNHLLPFG
jgi:hypothetical protein